MIVTADRQLVKLSVCLPTCGKVPCVTTHDEIEKDLGWLFSRLTRRMITLEQPILAHHGLSMWGYAVLSGVVAEPDRPQVAVARGVGLDRTTMVSVLDELEAAGLVLRTADPSDRRARLLAPTPAGTRTLAAVRREIRALERKLVGTLPAPLRDELRPALKTLLADDG
jgi:DNA-binding MarR family transcriptional regulator